MADKDEGKGGWRDRLRHPSAQHRRQYAKNIALMLLLIAVCVMFYVIAIVRMGGG